MMEWILSSSALILALLVIRAVLGRRVSARLRYGLWLVVLLRLLAPVQLFTLPMAAPELPKAIEEESIYILPTERVRVEDADSIGTFVKENGTVVVTGSMGYARLEDGGETVALYLERISPAQILKALWALGAAAAALVLLASNLRFSRRLGWSREALSAVDCLLPVYQVEALPSPCLFGLFRPAVYVTPEVLADETVLRHVLAHEESHYRHGDHIWSVLRCVALAVHWWNPLVWLAVVLSRRDGELACDEGALQKLGDGERSVYGGTLLTLVTAKPRPGDLLSCATTMTAGKRGLKVRIREIACKRKALISATIAAILIALVAGGCAFGGGEREEGFTPDTVSMCQPLSSFFAPAPITDQETVEQLWDLYQSFQFDGTTDQLDKKNVWSILVTFADSDSGEEVKFSIHQGGLFQQWDENVDPEDMTFQVLQDGGTIYQQFLGHFDHPMGVGYPSEEEQIADQNARLAEAAKPTVEDLFSAIRGGDVTDIAPAGVDAEALAAALNGAAAGEVEVPTFTDETYPDAYISITYGRPELTGEQTMLLSAGKTEGLVRVNCGGMAPSVFYSENPENDGVYLHDVPYHFVTWVQDDALYQLVRQTLENS